MTAADINRSLYRPILSGNEYNALMPNSSCKTTKLATGNTKVAINEMAKWAKQHAHQTARLAPIFAADTLEDTVDAIQWFLYNHYNYSIDGTDQNLKSPACAWSTRKQGLDCKSYSITASTLLLNLGINHFLRRIKQQEMSDSFTHVYVVVPIDQNIKKLPPNARFNTDYFIIDGTIEHNDELPFLEKDDIYMESNLPIYGMAAGLNCANGSCNCQDHAQPLEIETFILKEGPSVLDEPFTPEAVDRVYANIEQLANKGVDENVLLRAIDNTDRYISMGIIPNAQQIMAPPPNQNTNCNNPDIRYLSGFGDPPDYGIYNDFPGINPDTGGDVPGTETDATKGGWFSNTVNNVGGYINKGMQVIGTIGQVVQIGTMLVDQVTSDTKRSWGASTDPASEMNKAMAFVVPAVNNILNNTNERNLSENLTRLDQFVQFMYTGSKHLREHHSNAKSTKKAHEEVMGYMQRVRSESVDGMIREFKNKGFEIITTPITADFNALENTYQFYGGRKFDTSHRYTVESRKITVVAPGDEVVYNADGTVQTVIRSSVPQEAGFGIGGMIILVGLGIGAIVLSKKNKSKNNNLPAKTSAQK